MRLTGNFALGAVAGIVISAFSAGGAAAQDAPPDLRRIELIVSTAAGGGTDTLVRQIAEELRPRVDAQLVIRNVPGDGSLLALSQAARAGSDEAVMVFSNFPNTILSQITRGKDSAVDIGKDLIPVAGFARTYTALVAGAKSGISSYQELQNAYKNGEQRLLGGFDRGGNAEIGAELLKSDAELPFDQYVAYDGSGDALAAVARGEVPATLTSSDRAYDGKEAGTLVPLLIMGATERLGNLPDVPTALDLGYRRMNEVGQATRVIHMSAGADPEIVKYVRELWRGLLTDPEVTERLAAAGVEIQYDTPEDMQILYEETKATLEAMPIVTRAGSSN